MTAVGCLVTSDIKIRPEIKLSTPASQNRKMVCVRNISCAGGVALLMTFEIVELALPDGPLMTNELQDPFVTKIGGRPTWPVVVEKLASLGITKDTLKCGSCGCQLFLVLQMDCPWTGEEGFYDRIIYVFGCNSRVCTETQGDKAWKAFVLQRSSLTKTEEPKKVALWDSIMLGQQQAVEEKMKDMKIVDDRDIPVYEKQYPVGFPPTRLHICEEMIREKTKASPQVEMIPAAYSVSGEEEWTGEAYESHHPMGVDKSFLAFQKRVSSYPRQCVRFSPAGTPLYFCNPESKFDAGCCQNCGQKRVFELQLMPAILSLLPTNEEEHLKHIPEKKRGSHPLFGDGMEWGTVLVFTCGTCTRSTEFALIEAKLFSQIESL